MSRKKGSGMEQISRQKEASLLAPWFGTSGIQTYLGTLP